MKGAFAALVLALAAVAISCRSRPPVAAEQKELAIEYGVESVRPPEAFALHVPPRGLARLVLRRPLRADPHGAAGFFAKKLGPEQRAELERHVTEHDLLARDDEPSFTAEGSGFLRLTSGSQRAEVSLLGKDAAVSRLRLLLDGIVFEAAKRPVAALRVTSVARVDGPNAVIDAKLLHQGTKPLEVAVLDPKTADAWLRARIVLERAGRLADERMLSKQNVAELVSRRRLPGGWKLMAPGSALGLALPDIRLPPRPEEISARVEVQAWVRQPGGERIEIHVSSAPTELGPEERPPPD